MTCRANIRGRIWLPCALEILEREYGIGADASRIASAAHLTGLHGRWEKIGSTPDIICDIGHNAHGLRQVFDQLKQVAQFQVIYS